MNQVHSHIDSILKVFCTLYTLLCNLQIQRKYSILIEKQQSLQILSSRNKSNYDERKLLNEAICTIVDS